MCYFVYIATDEVLETSSFVPNETLLYLEKPSENELEGLIEKFSKKNIYYVGSDQGCSCGFLYEIDEDFEDDENDKDSPQKLIDFITELTKNQDIELYCCWSGEEDFPIISNKILDIRKITLDNYFGPHDKEFITFSKQNYL